MSKNDKNVEEKHLKKCKLDQEIRCGIQYKKRFTWGKFKFPIDESRIHVHHSKRWWDGLTNELLGDSWKVGLLCGIFVTSMEDFLSGARKIIDSNDAVMCATAKRKPEKKLRLELGFKLMTSGFLGFLFATAQVAYITAMISHLFIVSPVA